MSETTTQPQSDPQATDHPSSRFSSLALSWALIALFGVAIAFRIVGLDHLPGINGDEAYYGAKVMEIRTEPNPLLITNSGLPLNPFYTGLLYLIHLAWPTPSFWVLRLPALLSGLLLLALAYPLLARVFDRPTALATTLLLACLPISIAYSRFGWDQSQTPLVALLCLYFVLQRQVIFAIAALVALLLVHPLNFFLAPILIGPVLADRIAQSSNLPPDQRWRSLLRLSGALFAGLLLAVGALFVMVPGKAVAIWRNDLAPHIGERLLNPSSWADFVEAYSDFLTGTTIYRYLTGRPPVELVIAERLVFGSLAVLLLGVGLPRLVRARDVRALGLVGGLAVSLVAFCLCLGPMYIAPGLERYAMFLLTPSCLVFVLLGRALGESVSARRWQAIGLMTMCTLLLAGFGTRYFLVLVEDGGESHRTSRTGPVEPKQAAFNAIVSAVGDTPTVTVLAEDWWCYQPLRYLSYGRPGMQVKLCRGSEAGKIDRTTPQRRLVVGFAGGGCEQWLAQHAPTMPCITIPDSAGRPALYIWDLGEQTTYVDGLIRAAAAAPAPDLVE